MLGTTLNSLRLKLVFAPLSPTAPAGHGSARSHLPLQLQLKADERGRNQKWSAH
jgi:hypothetical protein